MSRVEITIKIIVAIIVTLLAFILFLSDKDREFVSVKSRTAWGYMLIGQVMLSLGQVLVDVLDI